MSDFKYHWNDFAETHKSRLTVEEAIRLNEVQSEEPIDLYRPLWAAGAEPLTLDEIGGSRGSKSLKRPYRLRRARPKF